MNNFRNHPISLRLLQHTGLLDGDDAGYRDVRVQESFDPLVPINRLVRCLPIYEIGAYPGLCPYYGKGLGASRLVLLRQPAAYALVMANGILAAYGREVLVVDAWRSAAVQSLLWQDVRKRVLANEGLRDVELSIADEVRIGLLANDIGAYAPVVLNGTDHISISELKNNVGVAEAAVKLGLTPHEASHLYVTFMGNLGRMQMQLDTTSTTAHGSGGSADVFLWDTKAGKPTCLGVPFDWVGPESDMDFFENSENLEGYKAKIDSDPVLRQHLEECGIRNVDVKVFNRIRDERRLLFHTMKAVGATFWKGESWHFNFGNKLGGFTFSGYPDAGSGCHSIIKNVRGFDGEYIAVWGNGEAHRQARAILGY